MAWLDKKAQEPEPEPEAQPQAESTTVDAAALAELVEASAEAAERVFMGTADQSVTDRLKAALAPFNRSVDV